MGESTQILPFASNTSVIKYLHAAPICMFEGFTISYTKNPIINRGKMRNHKFSFTESRWLKLRHMYQVIVWVYTNYSRDPNKRTGTAIYLNLIFHPVQAY